MIDFQTSPERYQHWKLSIDGRVARLTMDVQEDQTLNDGYKLKLNSYDLGVDIELADTIQRLRFEHPEVRAVVVTSLKPRIFCAGANIYNHMPDKAVPPFAWGEGRPYDTYKFPKFLEVAKLVMGRRQVEVSDRHARQLAAAFKERWKVTKKRK